MEQQAQRSGGLARERRNYPRHAIVLNASVRTDGNEIAGCTLRDFCLVGVRVELPEGVACDLRRGAPVELRVRLPGATNETGLVGVLARVVDRSAGIQLRRMERPLYDALLALSFGQRLQTATEGRGTAMPDAAPASRITSRYLSRIVSQVVGRHMPNITGRLFEALVEEIGRQAEQATCDRARSGLFEDQMRLLRGREQFGGLLAGSLERQCELAAENPAASDRPAAEPELALVENDAFEEWLARSSLVDGLNDAFHEPLQRIRSQVARVREEAPGAGLVACAPETIGNALAETIEALGFSSAARRASLRRASGELKRLLGPVYIELSKRLRKLGLLPQQPQRAPPKQTSTADRTTGAAPVESGPLIRDPAALGELLNSAASGTPVDPELPIGAMVQQLLAHLAAEHGEVELGPKLEERVEATDDLAQAILCDPQLADGIKPWLKRFKFPLLNAALSREDFFRDDDHPTLRLVNQLDHIGMFAGSDNQGLDVRELAQLEELVERVAGLAADDTATLQSLSERLSTLEESRSHEYQLNVERVVTACEGRYRMRVADREVDGALARIFGDDEVHPTVTSLLDGGWRALLRLTFIQKGDDSPEWGARLRVIERLNRLLTGDPPPGPDEVDRERLVVAVEQGLSFVAFDPYRCGRIVDGLRTILDAIDRGEWRADQAELTRFSPRVEAEARAGDDAERHARRLGAVETLEPGDRIAFDSDDGRRRTLHLAWKAEDLSELVFVDERGLRVRSEDCSSLGDLLLRGDALHLDRIERPVVDRARQRLLTNKDEWLAFVTSYDPLTGLFNRRHLNTRLDALLARGAHADADSLLFIDLDQFKIVNNICGYEAGDKLLLEIAGLLRAEAGESAVFRIGGDQFAVLFEGASTAAAEALAERLRTAISTHRFDWQQRHLPINTSIGVVALAASSWPDAGAVIAAADSACSVAKDEGRNRVHRFTEDDAQISSRRSSMQWVVEVNDALDHDRIHLRAQRILPIQAEEGRRGHYEVLLGVVDEAGENLPIFEFIRSAEMYSRMGEVDRLMVRKAVDWLDRNRQRIDQIGGLAINLSGLSIGDDTLGDYIAGLLAERSVPAEWLCFEITETVAVANLKRAAALVERIRRLGCTFALDDFGSGLASYSYLKNLPVDFVKIDGVFIREILHSRSDYAVVKSINEIAHFLGMETIAEYVENDETLEFLRGLGVDYAQGFGIGRPQLLESL